MTATRPFTARQRSCHAPLTLLLLPASQLFARQAVCQLVRQRSSLVAFILWFFAVCPFYSSPFLFIFWPFSINRKWAFVPATSSGVFREGWVQEGGVRVKGNGQRWQSLCKVAFNMFTTKHFRLLAPRRLMGFPLSPSLSLYLRLVLRVLLHDF